MCPQFNGVGRMSPGFGAGAGLSPELRALLATNPQFMFAANTGRTPNFSVPGTIITGLADLSGNGHNGTVVSLVGGFNLTYILDGNGKPTLQFPAGGVTINVTGNIGVSTTNIFAWRYILGDAPGANTEVLFSDGNIFLAVNAAGSFIEYFDGSAVKAVGIAVVGTHDYILVNNGGTNQSTLYVDGVANGPQAYVPTALASPVHISCQDNVGGTYPLLSGKLYDFARWTSVANLANIITTFDAFNVATFGPHS